MKIANLLKRVYKLYTNEIRHLKHKITDLQNQNVLLEEKLKNAVDEEINKNFQKFGEGLDVKERHSVECSEKQFDLVCDNQNNCSSPCSPILTTLNDNKFLSCFVDCNSDNGYLSKSQIAKKRYSGLKKSLSLKAHKEDYTKSSITFRQPKLIHFGMAFKKKDFSKQRNSLPLLKNIPQTKGRQNQINVKLISESYKENLTDSSLKISDNLLINSKKNIDHVPNMGVLDSFDIIPSEHNEEKKELGSNIPINSCQQCIQYYEYLNSISNNNGKQDQSFLQRYGCKHINKMKPLPSTPEHFWSIGMPSTETCRERGYISDTLNVHEHKDQT